MTEQQQAGPDTGTDDRLTALEDEQERQGGILEQILATLKGRGTASASGSGASSRDPDAGKSIADLVREGVEQLDREKQQRADADTERQQRADDRERLARLEERTPAETVSSPAGRARGWLQRYGFGIDEPRK